MLIIHTENFTKFTEPRKFSCYGGMAPFGRQSGTSIHTRPHVSPLAHKAVKAALVQTAKSAIKDNPVIRRYASRLKAKGKEHGVVMNNVKNKMLHILFRMIETRRMWDSAYDESHEKKDNRHDQAGFKDLPSRKNMKVSIECQGARRRDDLALIPTLRFALYGVTERIVAPPLSDTKIPYTLLLYKRSAAEIFSCTSFVGPFIHQPHRKRIVPSCRSFRTPAQLWQLWCLALTTWTE